MSRVIFPSKRAAAYEKYTVDFASRLPIGATISSASVAATVYSGTDAAASNIVSGSASISGTRVTQLIIGGVSGVIYELTFTANTSDGQVLKVEGYLAVL